MQKKENLVVEGLRKECLNCHQLASTLTICSLSSLRTFREESQVGTPSGVPREARQAKRAAPGAAPRTAQRRHRVVCLKDFFTNIIRLPGNSAVAVASCNAYFWMVLETSTTFTNFAYDWWQMRVANHDGYAD